MRDPAEGRFRLSSLLLVASALAPSMVLSGPPLLAAATRGGELPIPLVPPTSWWRLDIRGAPVDPGSAAFIAFINDGGTRELHPDFGGDVSPGSVAIYGFPYVVVDGSQTKRSVEFQYWRESDGVDLPEGDAFPFYPIPDEAITQPHWIEGGAPGNSGAGGDRHMLLVDRDNRTLYELFALRHVGSGWAAGSGAFFDLKKNGRRPDTWTSADAAGLAILPGLVRYDEVYGEGEIEHAFRVTLRGSNGSVYPASHDAGSDPQALPMGARLRLKAGKDLSGFPPAMQKIFRAMKKYGLIMADNGTDMYVSGTYDVRWDNDVLNPAFEGLSASDFEVVQLGYMPQVPGAARVDGHAGAGASSNANGVLEPGETAFFEPVWTYQGRAAAFLTGAASGFAGPAGGVYSLPDASASYGSVPAVAEGDGATVGCAAAGDCYRLHVSSPAVRPATHWDAEVVETLSTSGRKTWSVHIGRSFTDVSSTHSFFRWVETLLHAGVAGGCTPAAFCPADPVTRAQMAVFLLRAEHGKTYLPPAATGTVFADVPAGSFAADFIERLAAQEVTAGCGGGKYCPAGPVTRAQLAVFLLRARHGRSFVPSPATGLFADVPASHPFAPWIERLAAEGVTSGCGGGNYCPDRPATRGQMAVFLSVAFGLEVGAP